MHPERIKKADKNMVNDVDYEGIDFGKIEKKKNICINVLLRQ